MKYIIVVLSFISMPALACKLSIPESYIPTFLAPPVIGHYQKCEDRPKDKCHCVENVDPWTTDFIDGELVHNSDKKFAKELAEKNAEQARIQKEEKCREFRFNGTTIAALREEMNGWLECKK